MFFKKEEVKSFDAVTLRLSGMRFTCEYEIINNGDMADISRYDIRYIEKGETRVPTGTVKVPVEEMIRMLNSCNVIRWDGFFGSHPKGVKDGIMFRFSARINGKEIKADGSENFPKGFREFRAYIQDSMRGQEE